MQQQLASGKPIEDVEDDLKLAVIKPLHTQWLVNNYVQLLTGPNGKRVVLKGWKKAGVSGLLDSTTVIPVETHFKRYIVWFHDRNRKIIKF